MNEVIRFGIDEAGKGPVFGPMVVAGVSAPINAIPNNVDDSKKLTEPERKNIAESLKYDPDIKVSVHYIYPDRIDTSEFNMNELTLRGHAVVLDKVASEGDAGTVDAPESDTDSYEQKLSKETKTPVTITAKNKADETDPLVQAASIIAKVERDEVIKRLQEKHGKIGSGYPSDPITQSYLEEYIEENGEAPPFARKSWSTVKSLL